LAPGFGPVLFSRRHEGITTKRGPKKHRTEKATSHENEYFKMGIFAENQAAYAAQGIVTFPLNDNKRPAVRAWNKIGMPASRELAQKFTDADGLGFVTNKRNGLAIIDVDITDESVLADVLSRHGETPMIVRTASGKSHVYYRYNGERRRIRPWEGLAIDLLGVGGFVVAPPTRVTKGAYSFLQGCLDDIDRLPIMRGLDASMYAASTPSPEVHDVIANDDSPDFLLREGRRGNEVWRFCMRQAHSCETFDMLKAHAREFNATRCMPPMADDQIVAAAASAWRYTERGTNRFGQHGSWLTTQEVNRLVVEPDVLVLLSFLKANNGRDAEFMIANGLAEGPNAKLPMNRKRLSSARDRLLELGYVRQTRAAGGWDRNPALFKWRRRGKKRSTQRRVLVEDRWSESTTWGGTAERQAIRLDGSTAA
jgi:hypothetical protein